MAINTNYDPQIAKLLVETCALTYVQFANSKKDPGYDGALNPPPGYKQTAVFTAPEICFGCQNDLKAASDNRLHLSSINPLKVVLTDIKALDGLAKVFKKNFFGFALEATDGSGKCIIALRGTREPYEWIMDANFVQVPIPLPWFENRKFALAKAHFGFLFLFAFLRDQIIKAACAVRNLQTCFVTGHSLGAALAVLAALNMSTKAFPLSGRTGKVQMYNFAGPRVGDPVFADAYNYFMPFSYRIVNLADVVTIVPPRHLKYSYKHVGQPDQEWSYFNQTGDIGDNHNLEHNYLPALQIPDFVTNKNSVPSGLFTPSRL